MLNKQKITEFRGEFAIAVQQLEKKLGVSISLGNISYNSNELRTKMTVKVGDKVAKPTKDDFRVGDVVRINHKKVNPNDEFEIIKINNKNIKVKKIDGNVKFNIGAVMVVSPGLLNHYPQIKK